MNFESLQEDVRKHRTLSMVIVALLLIDYAFTAGLAAREIGIMNVVFFSGMFIIVYAMLLTRIEPDGETRGDGAALTGPPETPGGGKNVLPRPFGAQQDKLRPGAGSSRPTLSIVGPDGITRRESRSGTHRPRWLMNRAVHYRRAKTRSSTSRGA